MITNNGVEGAFLTPGIEMGVSDGGGGHRTVYEQQFHHLLTPNLR